MSFMKNFITSFSKLQIRNFNISACQRRTLSTDLFTKGQNGLQSRSVQRASNCCNILNQNSIVFMPSIFNISKNQIRSYYLESTFPDSENRDLEPGEVRLNVMRVHRRGIVLKRPKKRNPLGENVPFAKAIVLKTLIKKPKKPNSANRKCVLVRTSGWQRIGCLCSWRGSQFTGA
ncbi:40S ribosomal protein S12, mitochondrial [Armadillidium nasatum]|uniref:40S ribosomal protein S12, mitochondrial n=1 Tax=Armadillidium nasatum TaxID=96803 RepID=A0A5N5TEU8_9CRUS|nr:40S ribosomal protein S12, mitochondrial [Armadillidium nasatum]